MIQENVLYKINEKKAYTSIDTKGHVFAVGDRVHIRGLLFFIDSIEWTIDEATGNITSVCYHLDEAELWE